MSLFRRLSELPSRRAIPPRVARVSGGRSSLAGGTIGNLVLPRDLTQITCARLDCALLRCAVDRHEPELRAVTHDPFEIIEQRPVNIPAHVDPVRQAVQNTS